MNLGFKQSEYTQHHSVLVQYRITGNFPLFGWYRYQDWKKLVPEKSTGTGTNWSCKKYRYQKNRSPKKVPVPEKIGPGKSTGTGKKWPWKKYRYRYQENLVPEKSTGAEKILGTHSALCHVAKITKSDLVLYLGNLLCCVQSNTLIWDPPDWPLLIDQFVTIPPVAEGSLITVRMGNRHKCIHNVTSIKRWRVKSSQEFKFHVRQIEPHLPLQYKFSEKVFYSKCLD